MSRPPRSPIRFSVAAAFALALSALIPSSAPATYIGSERIPTSSPVYRDLERLADTFGLMPPFLSMRPLRVVEATAFLDALVAANPEAEADPAYHRARRELDPDWRDSTRPLIRRVEGDEQPTSLFAMKTIPATAPT